MEAGHFRIEKYNAPVRWSRESSYSKARQFDRSLVLPFLDVVPDKLIGQKRYLLSRELCVLRRRLNADGVPLSAFAADNGFHRGFIGNSFRCPSHTSCYAGSYQRGSRRWRGPRSLPPRSFPRPRPPPPPPNPLRGACGLASLTVSARPPESLPFSAAIAFSASSSLGIWTKPKPRDRPVSRSVATDALSMAPKGSNSALNSGSVMWNEKLPT
jgi:hypothetical protein